MIVKPALCLRKLYVLLLLVLLVSACRPAFQLKTVPGIPSAAVATPSGTLMQTAQRPGTPSNQNRSVELTEAQRQQYFERLNLATNLLLKAQQALFEKAFEKAIELVDQSIEVIETADAIALKGSIYFELGQPNLAVIYWRKAVNHDEGLGLPEIPGLRQWLNSSGN